MNRRRIGASGVLAMVLFVGSAPMAHAEPQVDPAIKATARATAEEGLKLFDQGSYLAALDKFNRAYDLVQAPTMGLMAGRSLVKLGRLVEGSERLLSTSRLQLAADASDAFKSAVSNAAAEYKALLPRIPKLVIGLSGVTAREVEVTLDGKPVPTAILGIERATDPGHHAVQARRGAEVAVKEVDLKEGETLEVALKMKDEGSARPAASGTGEPGAAQRTAGWVLVGLGAAGVVVGVATGGVTIADRNTLTGTDHCTRDLGCPSSAKGDVDRYNLVRDIWPVGVAVGGAAAVTGVVLVVTAPRGRPVGGPLPFQPWVGLKSAGVMGVF
jgi:hypothetical protein